MSLLGKKILGFVSKPRKRDSKVLIPSYQLAKSIAILYTYGGDKKEESVEFLHSLIDDDKEVQVLCFIDKKEITTSKNPSFHIEQLNSWGKINSEEVVNFLAMQYDYLIHLDFELSEIMKSLLNRTNAKCRVGFHSEEGDSYYELMIGINKSAGTTNFAEQAVKYIKSIR